ncbi:unnamed protein product [Prorocentrum cordatum]|uniref:Uncharacterized protein n=1 Tax=Prorocentrum cordatum TaxID=2364126 RepID=A0ABN9XWX4_9DINO|nr:unnamed protein product [Polarella glacialis]
MRRMGKASLNRLQRSGGGSGTEARRRPARQASARRRQALPHRRQPATRSAAEAAAACWEVAARRGRSEPAGRLFDLAQRARLAEVAVQGPLAGGLGGGRRRPNGRAVPPPPLPRRLPPLRTMKGMLLGMPLTLPVVAALSWRVTIVRMELPPSGSSGELPKKFAMKVMTVVLNTAVLVLGWFATRLSSPLVTLEGFLPMFVVVEALEVWLFPVSVRPRLRLRSMLEPPTTTTSMVVAVVQCTVAQVPRLAAANIAMLLGTLMEFWVFFWQGLALQMPLLEACEADEQISLDVGAAPIAALASGDGRPDPSDERRATGGHRRFWSSSATSSRRWARSGWGASRSRYASRRARRSSGRRSWISSAHRDGLVSKLRLKDGRK